jgi:hypothetical protein
MLVLCRIRVPAFYLTDSWVVLRQDGIKEYLDEESFRNKYRTFGSSKVACLCSEIFTATPIDSDLEYFTVKDVDGNETECDERELNKIYISESRIAEDKTDLTYSTRKCIKRFVLHAFL